MPRTTLSKVVRDLKRPAINSVEMLVHAYMRAGDLNAEDVGKALGLTGSGFRSMMNRPLESWTIGDIKKTCEAVNCPAAEVYLELYNRSTTG